MLGLRFAKLIERHSKALAEDFVHRLHTSERTTSFRHVPAYELMDDAQELYQHLSDWMATRTEADIKRREQKIGRYRAQQHIPVEEFVWGLILSKNVIFDFIQREAAADAPWELISQLDFFRTLDMFFDRAMFHAICGWTQPVEVQDEGVRKALLGFPA
jgi:hypothetical protein